MTPRFYTRSGTPVRWFPSRGKHDYHASVTGSRAFCGSRDQLLKRDPRVEPSEDPSRDPWACPICQTIIRRAPTGKPSIKVLNRVWARAVL